MSGPRVFTPNAGNSGIGGGTSWYPGDILRGFLDAWISMGDYQEATIYAIRQSPLKLIASTVVLSVLFYLAIVYLWRDGWQLISLYIFKRPMYLYHRRHERSSTTITRPSTPPPSSSFDTLQKSTDSYHATNSVY